MQESKLQACSDLLSLLIPMDPLSPAWYVILEGSHLNKWIYLAIMFNLVLMQIATCLCRTLSYGKGSRSALPVEQKPSLDPSLQSQQ